MCDLEKYVFVCDCKHCEKEDGFDNAAAQEKVGLDGYVFELTDG